jgi:hypothetical protein
MNTKNLIGIENAWIDPEGNIYPVGYMCHNEWAEEHLAEIYKCRVFQVFDNLEKQFGYDFDSFASGLHILGWVKLMTWTEGKTQVLGNCSSMENMGDTIDPKLNDKQRNTLVKWCRHNKFEFKRLFDY